MESHRVFDDMVTRTLNTSIAAALVLFAISAGAGSVRTFAQTARSAPTVTSELEIIEVRPNFFMIVGGGANVAVQTGADGTIVVDAGAADRADEVVAAIRKVASRPIRYVINTGPDADHLGGNQKVAEAGRSIFASGTVLGAAMTNRGSASILANENVLLRMSAPTGEVSPYPASAWPTETFETGRKYMYWNGEAVEVLHQPNAHSDGDSFVMFRRSDVVVAGDILDTRAFPVIDVSKGGSIQGEIAALNRLVALAVPSIPLIWQEGGTYVVPGHGRLSDQTDVVEYRDMVTIIHDRVRTMVDERMTLAQVLAANPAQGYIARYGASSPETARRFVESIYASLTVKREPGRSSN